MKSIIILMLCSFCILYAHPSIAQNSVKDENLGSNEQVSNADQQELQREQDEMLSKELHKIRDGDNSEEPDSNHNSTLR